MKWLIAMILLHSLLSCRAQGNPRNLRDGGGRDVKIALFSAQPKPSVTVAAAGPEAWWALCASCRHQPFTSTLRMPATQEIFAGGPLTVRDEEHSQTRAATGLWHLRKSSQGTVDVVLTLPSERYVAAVLMGETYSDEPRESLRAMAVVARTFVLRAPSAAPISGHLASDVCDSTACQAVRLGPVSAAVSEAVRGTAGETLWFGQQRAQVFFSGSCGGTTESAGAVWPKLAGLPYLRSMPDPYCLRKDHAPWRAEVPMASLREIALREGWRIPSRIVSVQVADRTPSQRVRTLAFTGESGERNTVSASALRLAVGRSLGWNLVRSDAYDLHTRDGLLVFDGRGHGHGVGLCQQGATEMARLGKTYREILEFYFPGTAVHITHADGGWQQLSQDGLLFTSATLLSAQTTRAAADAWRDAKNRFPTRAQPPSLLFAPTTELFRQMTSQPGWQIASTSGSTVVLQPASVFTANHVSLESTLRHEMLHVAVEANASPNAPLWLREGLVEVLTGDAATQTPTLSADETERLLRSAITRQQSQAAHQAAAARARLLMDRYGLSAVRGWLEKGSPVPPS